MIPKSLRGDAQEEFERSLIVEEDLRWLISQGVRDGETLAVRLGFTNVQTFERYCYRRDIPLLHKKSPFLRETRFVIEKMDGHLIKGAYKNPPQECQLAVRCVERQLGKEHPSVPDVLDMLGLAPESQLIVS